MRKPLASLARLALVFVSAVVFVAPTAASAATQDSIDQEVGVWKMNPEKSHWPGVTSPTSRQMTVEKQGPSTVRIVMDTVTQDGQKHRQELVRGYDGKERPVPGQTGLTQACEVLDTKTSHCTERQEGKVVLDLLMRLSEDGKTRDVLRTQFDQDGKPLSGLGVYEKQ
jgi:hypothetical protein